eukprot:Blabericola_migrator_1__8696@NODE_457_length_8311_cov_49_879791_g358_i0_p2_GENE_NODE_457_length_8311_cov_49_879791_g358_i0NODE_457_length_8311_cov_49_879791_g358_i0_p2_ORF_typecomplete_len357_score48_62Galactosyl_T/PF01762_21/4_6e27Fringe/PF02434_16/7_3e05_NODE_457_length_8311_cov_49_879791_g358_i071298199
MKVAKALSHCLWILPLRVEGLRGLWRSISWAATTLVRDAPEDVWGHLNDFGRLSFNTTRSPHIQILKSDYADHILTSLTTADLASCGVNLTELVHMTLFADILREPPLHQANATVFVLTTPRVADNRRVLRKLHQDVSAKSDFKLAFRYLLGYKDHDTDYTSDLLSEFDEFQDLLILNMTDSWTSLSTKVMTAFYYFATRFKDPNSVMIKMDDDVVVNWPKVQNDLLTNSFDIESRSHWWVGEPPSYVKVIKEWESRYLELFRKPGVYNPYANGPFYLMNQATARRLAEQRVRKYPIPTRNDDALLGDLAVGLNIPFTELREGMTEGCGWWYIHKDVAGAYSRAMECRNSLFGAEF